MVKPVKSKAKKRASGSPVSMKFFGALRKVALRSLPYALSLTTLGMLFGGQGRLLLLPTTPLEVTAAIILIMFLICFCFHITYLQGIVK